MLRVRFKTDAEDPRPISWPIPHPYWVTGFNDTHSVIVAYADNLEQIQELWPEAEDMDPEEVEDYVFTSRFSKPDWMESA